MDLSLGRRRRSAAVSVALAASFALAACGGGGDEGEAEAGGGGAGATTEINCDAYKAFGDLNGKTVSIYTSIVAPEDQPHINSYKPFEECTGAKVTYEGSKEFEAQLIVRVKAGNAPDIAFVPQPGLLATLVRETGAVKPADPAVAKNVDQYWDPAWKEYGSVDGTFYAAPLGANVKSFIWYSPTAFEEAGYEVPKTWDELVALSDQIAADGQKPWCAGIGSGEATGWPATDWMEDVMLRMHGPEVYDQWYKHQIPFNDPKVVEVLDRVGSILKNDKYVNAGLGDVKSIASTTFQDGGLPILDGSCWLHRQASFYAVNFTDAGAEVGPDKDVFAFYFPAETAEEHPVLGAGEFVATFADRPEVKAFATYLSSPEWANIKAQEGAGWLSANKELDVDNVDSEIAKESVRILQDPNAVFRFDASDLMPGAVGSGTFWRGMTDWITGKDTKSTLDFIEQSWPAPTS
jgi:alpha-glucoside transport system substrate-binding protein